MPQLLLSEMIFSILISEGAPQTLQRDPLGALVSVSLLLTGKRG